jgi:hypothetical protein
LIHIGSSMAGGRIGIAANTVAVLASRGSQPRDDRYRAPHAADPEPRDVGGAQVGIQGLAVPSANSLAARLTNAVEETVAR